jgi:acyl dehydratase
MSADTGTAPGWEALSVGAGPEPKTVGPITRTDFVRYQGASGDMNPVHHDEPFAKAAGFPAPLGVGMWPAGTLSAWAAAWVGPERVRRVRIRWQNPVFPGEVLTMSAAVASRDESARTVELELTCTRQDGAITVRAWLTAQI